MAATYSKDRGEIGKIVSEVLIAHHSDLDEAKVKIGVLLAYPGEDDELGFQPVKLHGYPCAAVIKINSAKNRLEGLPDATITIDANHWKEELDDDGRAALIDHELTHLEVCRDKEGHIKSDDAGRPKLKMRLHDIQLGVFRAIIKRYGVNSIDGHVIKTVVDEYGQGGWEWAEPTGKRKHAAVA